MLSGCDGMAAWRHGRRRAEERGKIKVQNTGEEERKERDLTIVILVRSQGLASTALIN